MKEERNNMPQEVCDEELNMVSGGMRIQHNMTAADTNRELGLPEQESVPRIHGIVGYNEMSK